MHKLFRAVVLFLIIYLLACPLAAQNDLDFAVAEKYEVTDGFLLYDKDYVALAIQYKNEDLTIISDYCSYPAVKPDKNMFAFLEPWGFEETSKLLFYNVTTRKTKAIEIPEIPENNTAKEIVWLDNKLLLIIAGFDTGTVTVGGNLYFYDDTSGTSGLVIDCKNQEISDIKLSDDNIMLTIVGREYQYVLANYVNIIRDTYTTEITIKELRRLIETGKIMEMPETPEKTALLRLQVLAGWLYSKTLEACGFDPVEIIIKQPQKQVVIE